MAPAVITHMGPSSMAHALQISQPWPSRWVTRFDAPAESIFLSDKLRYVADEIFRKDVPPLYFRDYLQPCITVFPEGFPTYSVRQVEAVGKVQAIANATDDMPTTDALLREFDQHLQAYGGAYDYSIFDQKKEQAGGFSLTIEKGVGVRERMEEKFEEIAKNGDAGHDLAGLFNHASIPIVDTTAGYTSTGMTKDWLNAGTDGPEINADVSQAIALIKKNTKNVERGPFTIYVGTLVHNKLKDTPFSTTFPQQSIKQYIVSNNENVADIQEWPDLNVAGADGKNRVLFLSRRPDKVKLLLPVSFSQIPPQEVNYGFKVSCYGICGGIVLPKPRAHLYLDLGGTAG